MEVFQKMSESEKAVMEIVWQADSAITSADIITALETEKPWKQSTVWTFLGRLEEKNLLTSEKNGNTKYYSPTLTKLEYTQKETEEFVQNVHQGSLKNFFVAFSGGKGLKPEEAEELKNWLNNQ